MIYKIGEELKMGLDHLALLIYLFLAAGLLALRYPRMFAPPHCFAVPISLNDLMK